MFLQLATEGTKGVVQNIQIIYTTHSPLLIDLQRFEQIRLLRKKEVADGKPKQTEVCGTTREEVTREVEKADGVQAGSYSPEGTFARLQTLMTPWTNEGFFADVVVLVEGEEDRAAILGVAKAMGHDLESKDIAVIPCMGKGNLYKAAAIFKNFGIPTYVIWDSDQGNRDEEKKQNNHRLLRIFGAEITDCPEMVTENFAYFKVDLGTTLRDELGADLYESLLEQCKTKFGYDKAEQAKKNPVVVQTIIEEAKRKGKESQTLERIVTNIVKLKEGT